MAADISENCLLISRNLLPDYLFLNPEVKRLKKSQARSRNQSRNFDLPLFVEFPQLFGKNQNLGPRILSINMFGIRVFFTISSINLMLRRTQNLEFYIENNKFLNYCS